MLQIGICDDQKDTRFKINSLTKSILENKSITHQIYEFSTGEGLIKWYTNHIGELDLVFLDIEMSSLNGMETAKKLHNLDTKVLYAFITGYPDYVFDGYSVGALGYILKPPTPAKLEDIITRALEKLNQEKEDLFLCKNNNSYYRIIKSSILYFQSQGRIINCITTNKTYSFYGKLENLSKEIGKNFIRIHQRYLVNAYHVQNFDKTELTIKEQTLPISRAYSQSAMADLTKAIL